MKLINKEPSRFPESHHSRLLKYEGARWLVGFRLDVHVLTSLMGNDIVLLSKDYNDIQGLLEGGTSHAAAPKTKVMSLRIPDEQRQAVLFDVGSLQGVGKFKHPCSGNRKD